jgi:hypothetical protein
MIFDALASALVMPVKTNLHGPSPAARAHMEELLDEALNETFPASDPVAINIERRSDQRPDVSDAILAARSPTYTKD